MKTRASPYLVGFGLRERQQMLFVAVFFCRPMQIAECIWMLRENPGLHEALLVGLIV
jgi:hypothetical protein